MFSAFQLLEATTKFYLYPHIIFFSPETNRWIARPRKSSKLIPFYSSNIFIPVIGVGSCLQQIFKYMAGFKDSVPGTVTMLFLFLVFGSMIGWPLSLPTIFNAPAMIEYINAVVDFEKKLFPNKKPFKPATALRDLLKSIITLLKIGKFCRIVS